MISSIKKYSKSIFFKILVGIIILPFLFWGMGDVFRGGSQNVVAKIESEKISTQEFVNYIKILGLDAKQTENLKTTDLTEKILSNYIGKKVLKLELEKFNVEISDTSLKDILINDKTFFKDNKFSRTEYEKFLLTNNLSAATFEDNLVQQEKKRQLLSYLSDGIKIPDFLVQYEFNKENQTKYIDYIDLKKFYNRNITQEEIKKNYNENKSFYSEIFKNIEYTELEPSNLIGKDEFNESFFKKINEIENKVLDGLDLNQLKLDYGLQIKKTGLVNKEMQKIDKSQKINIEKNLFDNFFLIEKENSLQFLNINEKFYLARILKKTTQDKKFEDKDVQDSIKAQIIIKDKINNNTQLAKQISEKTFNKETMKSFANKNNLEIKSAVVKNINENTIFKKGVIKRIFETDNDEINFITDNLLKDNFIIYTKKTEISKIDSKNPKYEDYKLKAKLKIANEIYNNYDLSLNKKYNVEINNKTLSRIKNSF